MKRIYFNNAATTPLNKHVLKAIWPYLTNKYGNPSGLDKDSRMADYAIEKAREQVANALGCNSSEIFFTSGASESNSWIAKCSRYKLISSYDSHSSLDKYKGNIYLEMVKSDVYNDERPTLFSYPLIDSETGSLNSLAFNIPTHLDLTQALGKVNINLHSMSEVKFASASAHKIGGLKGCGFLYIKEEEQQYMNSLIDGHQENGLRGGTQNVVGIVSLGKAIEIATKDISEKEKKNHELRKIIIDGLKYKTKYNVSSNIINITFKHLNAQTAVVIFDKYGVSISAGSACNFNVDEPSPVLLSEGYTEEEALNTIRISLGVQNTKREARKFVKVCQNIIDKYDN